MHPLRTLTAALVAVVAAVLPLSAQQLDATESRIVQAVAVPAGECRVVLAYEPPGLRRGLALSLLGLATVAWLLVRSTRRRR